MILSREKNNEFLIYFMLIYILTKDFWDVYLSFVNIFFYIIILWGTVMYFILFIIDRRYKYDAKIVSFFALYCVYIILNGVFKCNQEQFIRGIFEYILYTCFFFSSCYYVRTAKLKKINYHILINISCLISILALYEYIMKKAIIPNENYSIYSLSGRLTFRAKVFSASPLTLAMILGIILIIAFGIGILYRIRKYLIYSIIILIGIFSTASRGPMISAGIGCGFILLYKVLKELKSRKKLKNTIIKVIIGILVLMIIFLFIIKNDIKFENEYLDSFVYRLKTSLDFENESGNVMRIAIWEKFFNIIKQNIFFGIGLATTSGGLSSNIYNVTESGILKILVETGIVGMGLYFLLISIILHTIFKYAKKNSLKRFKTDYTILIAIVIAVLIENIILQVNSDIIIMLYFWFLISWVYISSQAITE